MSAHSKPKTIGEVLEGLGLGRRADGAMGRERVFEALRRLGVERAEIEFSGGNDEGGVSEVRFCRSGEEAEEVAPHGDYDHEKGRWVRRDGYPQALIDGLAEPVYRQYGTFAGDYYVEGTITWEVGEETVTQTGSEEIPRAESIDREL